MVYIWDAAWVTRSALPMMLGDNDKPLGEDRRYPDGNLPGPRDSYIIPDVIKAYFKRSDVGYSTVSLSDRVAAVVARFDKDIELMPHVVRWRDGSTAQRRYILAGCPDLLALDDRRSRHKVFSKWQVGLQNIDDCYIFDRAKIGSHHIWRSSAIYNGSLLGTDEFVDELLNIGATGLFKEHYPEQQDGAVSGPEYRPNRHIFLMVTDRYSISEGPTDGNLEAVRPAEPLPDEYSWIGRGQWPRSVAYGIPVLSENMPTKWRYGSGERHLPGFMGWGGVYTVSEQFREIIERFEPAQHQFFPVNYVTKKGELIEKRFIMVICKIINALDREKSDPGQSILWRSGDSYRRNLIVDSMKVAHSHLWLDHYFGHNNNCFVSYELARALEQAHPKKLYFNRFPLN